MMHLNLTHLHFFRVFVSLVGLLQFSASPMLAFFDFLNGHTLFGTLLVIVSSCFYHVFFKMIPVSVYIRPTPVLIIELVPSLPTHKVADKTNNATCGIDLSCDESLWILLV